MQIDQYTPELSYFGFGRTIGGGDELTFYDPSTSWSTVSCDLAMNGTV